MKVKSWNILTKPLSVPVALAYSLLWTPVIIFVVFSFSNNRYGMKWEGFTLQWYAEILRNIPIREALTRSLIIAVITVVVATVVGTLVAYGLYKYKFRGKKLLRMSILLPIMIPYVVTGGALLVYFTRIMPVPLGYPSIIVADITFSIPLGVFVVLGRMQRIDWSLEEASMDLGANRLTTFREITIPLLLPAILAAAALIFPWSFDDFVVTYFVAGVGTMTLPLYVFSQIEHAASTVVINAIGMIFIVVPIVGILLMIFFQQKRIT